MQRFDSVLKSIAKSKGKFVDVNKQLSDEGIDLLFPGAKTIILEAGMYNSHLTTIPISTWYVTGSATTAPFPIASTNTVLNGIYATQTIWTGMIVEYWDNISVNAGFAVNTAVGNCEQYPLYDSDINIEAESFYIDNNFLFTII
ncbi:hypothetical protein [Chryseobacterium sp.]|uniref:hypothetical protein n=1 Tax=Chryseobacterium sp. TaxID=1871047 RepID=UPI003890E197